MIIENNNPQYSKYKFTPEMLIYCVRTFLRDTAKQNELRGIDETDDKIIKLCINMAISDWNTTPPLLSPVGLEDFPKFDWLIVCTAMFVLQSAGVLQYRNELPFTDAGTTVNVWSKGPAYFNTAGFWAQQCEKQKVAYKVALNYSRTFGIARTSEYMMWDYSGIYTGVPGDNVRGVGPTSEAGGILGTTDPVRDHDHTPRSRNFNFNIDTWVLDGVSSQYQLVFYHDLHSNVDVRITDPTTGNDVKNLAQGINYQRESIKLTVSSSPDGRFSGEMIVFKI